MFFGISEWLNLWGGCVLPSDAWLQLEIVLKFFCNGSLMSKLLFFFNQFNVELGQTGSIGSTLKHVMNWSDRNSQLQDNLGFFIIIFLWAFFKYFFYFLFFGRKKIPICFTKPLENLVFLGLALNVYLCLPVWMPTWSHYH